MNKDHFLEPPSVKIEPKIKNQADQMHQCSICNKVFKSNKNLKVHKKTVHESQSMHSCKSCKFIATHKKSLQDHIRREHSNIETSRKKYFCQHCGKASTMRKFIERHELICKTKDKIFTCDICQANCKGQQGLMNHRRIIHSIYPEDFVACEVCGKRFSSTSLANHSRIEHPTLEVLKTVKCFCKKCLIKFNDSIQLNHHLKKCLTDSDLRHLKCSICDKKSDIWHSSIALKKHGAEQHSCFLHVCETCGESFASKNTYDGHRKIHLNMERVQYKCSVCPGDKSFLSQKALNNHLYNVHGDESCARYSCKYCDFKAVTRKNVLDHENAQHTKSEVFKCIHCDFTSFRKSNLNTHVKHVHEKYRPWKCNKCTAVFSNKRELKGHLSRNHHMILELQKVDEKEFKEQYYVP